MQPQFHSKAQSFGPTVISVSPLVSGEVGFPYFSQLQGIGGASPYTWMGISGTIPTGLTLNANGSLTGTPTTVSANSFTAQFTDANGSVAKPVTFLLTIAPQLQITTTSPLTAGTVGTAYSQPLAATGGVTPEIWALSSGSIDPGLILNPSTGVISGTPTVANTYTPTFQVTDALGYSVSHAFSLTIAPATSTLYLGTNLTGMSNWDSEQPFLNLFKMSDSNNDNLTAWFPQGTMTYAQLMPVLDSNGYPTSLPGSQTVITKMVFQINNQDNSPGSGVGNGLPAGAVTLYPSGSYTLQFQGACTLLLGGDAVSGSLATSSPNVAVSGLTITSTMTAVQTGSVTFNATPTTTGIFVTEQALPSNTNYFRNASLVQTSLMSLFNAGKICHPNFLSSISGSGAGGYKRLRFMDMVRLAQNNGGLYQFQVPALTTGSSLTQTLNTTWNGMNVTIPVVLGKGTSPQDTPQLNTATFTNGSTTVVFGSAFTASVSAGATNLWVPYHVNWANRNQLTGMSWVTANGIGAGGNGTPNTVPWEALVEICNETNCDGWFALPITINTFTDPTAAFWTSLATMIKANLNPGLKIYLELGNEIFLEADFAYCELLASSNGLPAGTWSEWLGVQYQQLALAFSTVFGASYASTVMIGPSTQFSSGNGVAFLEQMMNAPDWVASGHSAPYNQMTHWSCAPYFPEYQLTQADATTMLNTATPLDDFFACMYGNVGTAANGSHTYASVTGGGFIASTLATIPAMISGISAQPWKSLPIHCYEMGESFGVGSFTQAANSYTGPFGGGAYTTMYMAMDALFAKAHRDPRMGLCYYDPTNALFNTYGYANANGKPGFIPACIAAGITTMNKFANCSAITPSGAWGALENVMQLPAAGGSGTAASYPVYAALQNYIG